MRKINGNYIDINGVDYIRKSHNRRFAHKFLVTNQESARRHKRYGMPLDVLF